MRIPSAIGAAVAALALFACRSPASATGDAQRASSEDDALLRARFSPRSPDAGRIESTPAFGDVDGDGRTDAVVLVEEGGVGRLQVYGVRDGRVERTGDFALEHPFMNFELVGGGILRTWRSITLEEGKGLECDLTIAEETWRLEGGRLVRQGAPKIPEGTGCEAEMGALEPAPPAVPAATTAGPAASKGIRGVDFAHRRYESACGTRTPGRDKDGDEGWTLAVDDVIYGDLTNDGVEDAVVVLTCTTGGTAGPQPEAHVFTQRGAELVRLHKVRGGDKHLGPEGRAFSISGGKLRVVRTWQAGGALPMEEELETLRWDGSRFVRADYTPRHRVKGP